MLDRLDRLEKHYQELEQQMAAPEITYDLNKLQALAQEKVGLESLVAKYRKYKAIARSLKETRTMFSSELDVDMASLVRQEITSLESQLACLLKEIKLALLPKDPNDNRGVIMEIRAGTGGDEAGLFAADLFRMYNRYAQSKNWVTDIINMNETSIGSIKEAIFAIKGKGAFSRFKYERGVHRVQRVPTTESSGRIHTSTATVAVLPETDEIEVSIEPEDLKTDIFHSGGAGGQNVNKVATAVRITHLSTGMVVVCQDERSQLRNRTKAMSVLRARLLDLEQRRQEDEITTERRSQVGSGERAEKIRTYNFPQDRLTDHRTGLSIHNLPRIMAGGLDELIDAIATSEQAKQLEAQVV
jgi:peptide chain release factor 1